MSFNFIFKFVETEYIGNLGDLDGNPINSSDAFIGAGFGSMNIALLSG